MVISLVWLFYGLPLDSHAFGNHQQFDGFGIVVYLLVASIVPCESNPLLQEWFANGNCIDS